MPLTVKFLADKWNENLPKVRRWAREFLGPDPKATMRSGYTRELTLEGAFEVFMGGHLVSGLGFQIYEAKTIIEELRGLIKAKGFYPGKIYSEVRSKNPDIVFVHVHIMRPWKGLGLFYELREFFGQPSEELDGEDSVIVMEKYRKTILSVKGTLSDWRNVRVLGVTELLMNFNHSLKAEIGLQVTMDPRKLLELADDLDV